MVLGVGSSGNEYEQQQKISTLDINLGQISQSNRGMSVVPQRTKVLRNPP